jgi:hypothetical protein
MIIELRRAICCTQADKNEWYHVKATRSYWHWDDLAVEALYLHELSASIWVGIRSLLDVGGVTIEPPALLLKSASTINTLHSIQQSGCNGGSTKSTFLKWEPQRSESCISLSLVFRRHCDASPETDYWQISWSAFRNEYIRRAIMDQFKVHDLDLRGLRIAVLRFRSKCTMVWWWPFSNFYTNLFAISM